MYMYMHDKRVCMCGLRQGFHIAAPKEEQNRAHQHLRPDSREMWLTWRKLNMHKPLEIRRNEHTTCPTKQTYIVQSLGTFGAFKQCIRQTKSGRVSRLQPIA